MNKENNIDKIFDELLKKGSQIDYLKSLRKQSLDIIKKYNDLDICLASVAKQIKEQTELFLNQKNIDNINYISGISCLIYLPSFESNGEYKLKLMGGKTRKSKSLNIDENTLFNIDSITKLYTLILLFKLEKEGLIDLNSKIEDLTSKFNNLGGFTLNDLIIQEKLYKDNDYNKYIYTIISNIIERVISKKLGIDMSFEDIMYEYLLNPLNLYQTKFNPKSNNISGNGNKKKLKSNENNSARAYSGLFASSEDLAKLAKQLYRITYYNRGVIRKIKLDCIGNNEIKEFSNGSFLYKNNIGSVALFDPNNYIHQNILVNYNDEKLKNIEYNKIFDEYYKQIVKNTMLIYVIKEYYNKYCYIKEDINVTKYI